MLRMISPTLRSRIVNFIDLLIFKHEGGHRHGFSHPDSDALFTAHRLMQFNYHGHGIDLRGLLFGGLRLDDVSVAAYSEEGSMTTPLNVMLWDEVSRFHVAKAAITKGAMTNEKIRLDVHETLSGIRHNVVKVQDHMMRTDKDPEDAYDIPLFDGIGSMHGDVGYTN